MQTLRRLILADAQGASRFGVHFLIDWACPYRGALKYLVPHPRGGRGLVQRTKARPLLAGGGFHQAVEVWYRTRCQNPSTGQWCPDHGKPNMEAALHSLDTWVAENADKWDDPLEREIDHQLMASYMRRYHDHYGPQGGQPEFPDLAVYVDESGPWLEREVTIPLGEGVEMTVRIDMVGYDAGHLKVVEHKTTAASQLFALKNRMHMAAQPTAELLGLQVAQALPSVPGGVLVNIINKNPGSTVRAKTPPFARERVTRTEGDLLKFMNDTKRDLLQLDEWCQEWEQLTQSGVDPYVAAGIVFPRRGTLHDLCFRYNDKCPYWGICTNTGGEALSAMALAPRVPDPNAEPTPSKDEEDWWA